MRRVSASRRSGDASSPSPDRGPRAVARGSGPSTPRSAVAAAVLLLSAAGALGVAAADTPRGTAGAPDRNVGQAQDARPVSDTAAARPGPGGEREDSFPHRDHAGLFPVCAGCHQGAESGEADEMYPDPQSCGNCHDGRDQSLVDWRGATGRPTNLRFDHVEHTRAAGEALDGERFACTDCHTPGGAPANTVERAVAGACLDCHAHRADDHYVDAECSTCHRPLAESRLSRDRIEGFAVPSTHERSDFLARVHGEWARESLPSCTTCHTRQQCTDCHVDPEGVEAVVEMGTASADAEVPALDARYPVPEAHLDDDFLGTHGREFEPTECSTCHTRESCTSCHVEEAAPDALARLPSGEDVRAPGATVERRDPESHESPWFVEDHEAPAATGNSSCAACHAESWCADCHGATDDPGYHPANFAASHASRAYGREMECASCHDTSVFCRDCHTQLGMGTQGRLESGFHDREPAWLLRHGQAARQALESCASCHQQRDCLQCHSETGAFQVSPHGADFDARRLFDKNPQICFACHISDPLDGSRP